MGATRRHTITRGLFDTDRPRQLISGFPAIAGVLDALTRQCTFDKDGFSVEPGDAPSFVIKRFDDSSRHVFALAEKSRHCSLQPIFFNKAAFRHLRRLAATCYLANNSTINDIMPSKLITTWNEYEGAVKEILERAAHTLRIFDENLSTLKLDRPDRIAALRQFLGASPKNLLQIAVQDADYLRFQSPRLMELLAAYSHNLQILECPPHLATLSDSLILADGQHGLVRFHKTQARAKVIFDDIGECAPYLHRHEQILEEGGTPVSGRALGL
jgi:hypothetical protein